MGCTNASIIPSQLITIPLEKHQPELGQSNPQYQANSLIQKKEFGPIIHPTKYEYRQQAKIHKQTGSAVPIIRKNESNEKGELQNLSKDNYFDQHAFSPSKIITQTDVNVKERPSQITSSVTMPIIKKKIIEIEVRDQQILLDLPTVTEQGKINESELKRWITKLAQVVFSSAFHYYYEQKMTYDQTKIYCSQNLMKNIVLLNEMYKISAQQFQMMDRHLEQCSLDYINMKYPLTENVEVCRQLAKLVVQIDKMESIANNEVSNLKIDFEYRESQNYNDLIMKMLNKMITKVTHFETDQNFKEEEQQGEEQMTHLFSKFEQMITSLFQKVEDQDWRNGFEDQNQTNQQKEKYKNMVKQYTHFEIGRKIPQIVTPYTEQQIQNKDLTIKHPSILRILTKWCQELWDQFKEQSYYESRSQNLIIQKLHQIRYVYPLFRPILDKELEQEKQKILEYMNQRLKKNASMQIKLLQSQRLFEDVNRFLDQIDQISGKFTLNMVDNLHHLIIIYLNRLIHGLLSVSKTFLKLIDKDSYSVQWPYPPNLVSFRIGDLMRCKISSKEKEIIAIYNEIQKMSSDQGDIKIVRIKNRLKRNTNDILINIRFKDTILCEIQLAIKVKTSDFLKCSNSFQHFIYQLIRSQFGPITELCSIRQALDKRCNIYKKIIKKQKFKNKQIHSCETNKIKFKMNSYNQDFICDNCSYIYYDDNYATDHHQCTVCGYLICAPCRIKMTPPQNLKTIINFPQQIKVYIETRILNFKDITKQKYFYLLSIRSNKVKPILFFNFEFKQSNYWISKNDWEEIYEIYHNNKKEMFNEKAIIFSSNDNFDQSMHFDESEMINYVRRKIILQSFRKEKETIQLQAANLDVEQCRQLLYLANDKQKQNIKNLLLGFNNLTGLPFNPYEFPNLIWLGINCNPLQSLNYDIIGNKNLKTLILQACQLSAFPEILFQMPWLKRLSFYNDPINTIPEQIRQITSLTDLEIECCGLDTLPESIGECINLQRLSIQSNKLTSFPYSACNLINLKFLNLFNNSIQYLPEAIGSLYNLRELRMENNPINQLPNSFWDLRLLKRLYLFKTQIQTLSQLKNLSQLQDLQFHDTNIRSVPESLVELEKLTFIKFISYQEVHISDQVFHMTSLRSIEIQKCKQIIIPQNFMRLSLEKVNIYNNESLQIPDNVFHKMSSLKNLNLQNNKIVNFPQLDNSKNLITLNLSKNKIKIVPQLNHLKSLQNLDLSSNYIEQIEDGLLKLKQLKYLNLSNNQIKEIMSVTLMTSSLLHIYPKLTQINLSNNYLESVPFIIKNCKNLHILSLQNNLIYNISEDDFFVQSLKELTINTIAQQKIPLGLKNILNQYIYNEVQLLKNDMLSSMRQKKKSEEFIYNPVEIIKIDRIAKAEEEEEEEEQQQQNQKQVQAPVQENSNKQKIKQKEEEQKYTIIPAVDRPKCWSCSKQLSYPYYWLKWEDQATFGCLECVQAKRQNPTNKHFFKYQKNSIFLPKPFKQSILTQRFGKNIQPWNLSYINFRSHAVLCNNCRGSDSNGSFSLGTARYLCLGCGRQRDGFNDLCQKCYQIVLVGGQDCSRDVSGHYDDHPWLRVLYYTGGYYQF